MNKQEQITQVRVQHDHHVAMEEMHWRMAPSCSVPSISWHLALWPDPSFNEHADIGLQEKARKVWHKKVEGFLTCLEDFLTDGKSAGVLNFNHSLQVSDLKKTMFLMVRGGDFVWKVKVETHTEFVTITVTLSLSRSDINVADAEIDAVWPKSLNDVNPTKIQTAFDVVRASGSVDKASDENQTAELEEHCNLLYHTLWERLLSEALKLGHSDYMIPGYVYADFRGLIFSAVESNSMFSPDEKHTSRATNNYMPLINAANQDHVFKEHIVCSMLEHRVIYASTLGSLNTGGEFELHKANPVKFTLICLYGDEKKQIGRLLERIHTLGVTRLAALKDLDAIRFIGRKVQAMGLELDSIMQSGKPNLDEVQDFLERLNSLGQNMSAQETTLRADILKEGASYRISRSGYYQNVVRTRLEDLRIERIEGWQPYDEFLRRRLFPTLRFIDDVGKRIETLRSRVNSATFLNETRQARQQIQKLNDIHERSQREEKKLQLLNWLVGVLTIITATFGIMELFLN